MNLRNISGIDKIPPISAHAYKHYGGLTRSTQCTKIKVKTIDRANGGE